MFHQGNGPSTPGKGRKQLTYNSEAIHVLKDSKTNTVVGGVSIGPLTPEVLEKLIGLEIDEAQIRPEDYLPYTTDPPLDCYIIDFVVRPGLMATYYGSKLMQATLDYFLELLNRGVVIRRIYAATVTKSGERLAKGLHFKLLQSDWTREHEEFRHSYVLDLENTASNSRLVKQYLKQRRNLAIRMRRRRRAEASGILQ
jgi:hypothetical protein